MRSLIWEIVDSILAPAVKKRFLRAPYVPLRRYLGCYQLAFENGVVLGYAFRDRLTTFGQLFSNPGRELDLTTQMQKLAKEVLENSENAKDFFDLGMFAEEERTRTKFRESGLSESRVEYAVNHHKLPLKSAQGELSVAVSAGIGFGSAFPELTEQLWRAQNEQPVSAAEWAKWRKAGLDVPEEPAKPVPLADRQQELVSYVESYVARFRPELLPQFRAASLNP